MKAEFDNTVSILVKAWLDGTLLKGHCCACAVGNICATSLGVKVVGIVRPDETLPLWQQERQASWAGYDEDSAEWRMVFMTTPDGLQSIDADNYHGQARREIEATGYSWQELARIEFAFETAEYGYDEAAEFAGLMAVVDVLADIHGIDLATAEVAKGLFVKEAASC